MHRPVIVIDHALSLSSPGSTQGLGPSNTVDALTSLIISLRTSTVADLCISVTIAADIFDKQQPAM